MEPWISTLSHYKHVLIRQPWRLLWEWLIYIANSLMRKKVFLRPGPPFVPSDPLVGERIEGLLGLSPSIRAISPFPVERHPSNATVSNCLTSPSTAGLASKGKLFISSNTCGSISPAIRSNYWIWASSSASKPVEAKVLSNKLSLLTLHLHIDPFLHLRASL